MDYRILKTERTHTGHGRLLDLVGPRTGYIERQAHIPSPYRYSPEWFVYDYKGCKVVLCETAHRTFRIIEVDAAKVYTTSKF